MKSDQNHFEYQGNAKIILNNPASNEKSFEEKIDIISVDHMIPILVKYRVDSKEYEVHASIDYGKNNIFIDSRDLGGLNPEKFKGVLAQWLIEDSDRRAREFEESNPPIKGSVNLDVPTIPWMDGEDN